MRDGSREHFSAPVCFLSEAIERELGRINPSVPLATRGGAPLWCRVFYFRPDRKETENRPVVACGTERIFLVFGGVSSSRSAVLS